MNKRFFIALILTAIVIVITPLLFPNTARRSSDVTRFADSSSTGKLLPTPDSNRQHAIPKDSSVTRTRVLADTLSVTPFDTATVLTPPVKYSFTSRGGVPISVSLSNYLSRQPGQALQKVELVSSRSALTSYHLIVGKDTIALDTISFRITSPDSGSISSQSRIVYVAEVNGHMIHVQYAAETDTSDSYLLHVAVNVSNTLRGSMLLVDLPRTLPANGPDTVDDLNHLAVSYRPARGEINSIAFGKLDSTETITEPGPLSWVAVRNKYFLVAFRMATTPFASFRLKGLPRQGKIATQAVMSAVLPLQVDGSTAFDVYAGPQDFQRLQHLGGDLDQVNPYAGWLHPVVQPFATMVMKSLLWMKHTTHLNYGWVLVLFGIVIRLVLWPLNQSAMRTSMKMQRLQPELQALQKRHSDDPKKQQEAIMRLYKEHNMSPLSPLMGCLPMLLPMPVLFALYYVFQNTIEFRGVPFLWLPDISLHDPFYITPLLMGVSMFIMSWIGLRNAPPNPQAKMMSYMMPVMFTVLFLNFASGLNLYYAVQNIAALPQQWLLARERGKPGNTPGAAVVPQTRRS